MYIEMSEQYQYREHSHHNCETQQDIHLYLWTQESSVLCNDCKKVVNI